MKITRHWDVWVGFTQKPVLMQRTRSLIETAYFRGWAVKHPDKTDLITIWMNPETEE